MDKILGDPGAVSRVDKMFVVKVYCKIETSPWALTLTEPVPEAFELPASDWPKKIFLANQRREAAGWLSCFITRTITFWLSYRHKQTSISSQYWRTSCLPQSFDTSRSAPTMEQAYEYYKYFLWNLEMKSLPAIYLRQGANNLRNRNAGWNPSSFENT